MNTELDILEQKKLALKLIEQSKGKNWGQRKGGLMSKGSLKEIKIPKKSKELAELVGIILGDGNINYFKKGKKIGTYMLRISGDKRYDYDRRSCCFGVDYIALK